MSEFENRNKHSIDMTVGKPIRLMFRFALPLLLGNLFQQLYNTVDSIVVGRMIGTQALAAVGSGFPFLMAMTSLFIGIGIAGTVIISQYFGARDLDSIRKTVGSAYRFCFVVATPIMILGVLLAKPVLAKMQVPDDGTLTLAATYLQIIFLGLYGSLGYNMNAAILQGLGDSFSSVRFLIIATVTNTILDVLFVGPLGMGVAGAAIATIASQWLSWILGLIYINRHYKFLKINLLKLDYDKGLLLRLVRMGIPSGLQNMLFSIGIMVMVSLVNRYGSVFMAGFNGANKIDSFVFLPIMSFTNALTAYTGQNIGARRMDRVSQGIRSGLVLTIITSLGTAALIYPLSGLLMRLFTDDPEAVKAGITYLHSVLPFFFILAALFTVNAVLRGTGQMMIPMISSFAALWLVRLPVAYFLANNFGRDYMFYCFAVGWVVGCTISVSYYLSGRWKKRVLEQIERNGGPDQGGDPIIVTE